MCVLYLKWLQTPVIQPTNDVCVTFCSPTVCRRHLGHGRSDEEDEVDRGCSSQTLRQSDGDGTQADSAS